MISLAGFYTVDRRGVVLMGLDLCGVSSTDGFLANACTIAQFSVPCQHQCQKIVRAQKTVLL